MNSAINYREMVLKELTEIPEEFIPFLFQQIKAYNEGLKSKKNNGHSPATRLLNLAGTLENPERLNAKQYKKKIVEEYLAHAR